ncbi:MAG: DUF134 domain-containing protein [Bacteroidota bacterium]
MPRPKNNRIVHVPPVFSEFKPIGVPSMQLDRLELSLDEFEAIRLADHAGYSHEEAAVEMEVSRSTFSRLIEKARQKMASFLIEGKSLVIAGGNVHFRNNIIRCNSCGHMFKTEINGDISECPNCGSANLVNLAGGFGHGRCCTGVHHKKGGYHARRR